MASRVTFFCDFSELSSVANPLIDNSTGFKLIGGFEKNWKQSDISFENSGFGIKKKNGCIYTNNHSNLFSMEKGYVNIVLSTPYAITDGIIDGIEDLSGDYNKWIIWGTNVGEVGPIYPSISLQFTNDGIEFKIQNERGTLSIVDDYTTVDASDVFSIECIWNCNGIDDFEETSKYTVAYRVNGETKAISNFPLSSENEASNLCIFNTPFLNNNLEMTIVKLIIGDGPIIDIEDEFYSSSSSSSSSDSSSSSTSSDSSISSRSSWSSSSSSTSS